MPRGILEFDAAPSVNSHEIVPFEPTRLTLTFCPPINGAVTVHHEPITTDGNGLTISAGQSPFRFTFAEHGEVVRRAWFCKGMTAGSVVAWIETYP